MRSRYSSLSIFLHWLIALLVAGQFIGMSYLEGLERGDPFLGPGYMLHKSTGLTILALTLVRIVARLTEKFPELPEHMAMWERILARSTHIGFYGLLLLMPVSGWAFGVTAERGLDWYGLFGVPELPLAGLREVAHEAHEVGAYAFLVLIAAHVAGALKHHLLDRDTVLHRMLPVVRQRG